MKQTKRMLALLLSVCMIFAMLPAAAYGADAPPEWTGEESKSFDGIFEWEVDETYGSSVTQIISNEVSLSKDDWGGIFLTLKESGSGMSMSTFILTSQPR